MLPREKFVSSAYQHEGDLHLFLVGILFAVHAVHCMWSVTPHRSALCVGKMFDPQFEYMILEVHGLTINTLFFYFSSIFLLM